MPKRRARRPARPRTDQDEQAGKYNIQIGRNIHGVAVGSHQRAEVVFDRPAPAPPDSEGIDYSDIPDVGDDDAYWKGGRVGPVLPVKAAERPS